MLDADEQDYFISLLESQQAVKGESILSIGESCTFIHFVNSGMLRAYFLNEKGKDTTVMFAKSDWWITDMHGFARQKSAMITIEVLSEALLWRLSKQNMESLCKRIAKFERFFRIIMQNAYIREQLRNIQNLSQPAEERYYHFLAKYPDIAGQVTQKQIASYLGITPEFLSNIRAHKR